MQDTPNKPRSAGSRFIPSEEIVGSVAQWRFGAVNEAELRAAALQAERVAGGVADPAGRQRVWDEGFSDGFAQGHAAAAAEARHRLDEFRAGEGAALARQMAALLAATEDGLYAAQERMAQGVLDLACALARQVVRNELEARPEVLLPVVREALGMLESDTRAVSVRLHPDTLHTLQPALQEAFGDRSIAWLPDPSVGADGCLVESAGTVIDGTLEKRWARAVARLGADMPWHEEPTDGGGDDAGR